MNINLTNCSFEGKTYNRVARKCKGIVEETSHRVERVKKSNSAHVKDLNKQFGGSSLKEIKKTWEEGCDFLSDLIRVQFK